MKKRLLGLLLCLALLLPVLPLEARAAEGWSGAYETFVLRGQYAREEYEWYETVSKPQFGLRDMDLDGTPELIALYCPDNHASAWGNRVFGYRDGSVVYLGYVSSKGEGLYTATEYPGLFVEVSYHDYQWGTYYYLSGGELANEGIYNKTMDYENGGDYAETFRTDDKVLQAAFDRKTLWGLTELSAIRSGGWDSFVSRYVTVQPAATGGFTDVKDSDYFVEPVKWAVEQNITQGTGDGKFSPNDRCTRGQAMTFLYRSVGSPAVSGDAAFSDVSASDYYYNPVRWAVRVSVTDGTGDGKFSPGAPCTRGQIVTFLYRAVGSPPPGLSGPVSFSDVSPSDYYYNAVRWAVGYGITDGTGGGKFSPNDPCTRGQIVTFLYRAAHQTEKEPEEPGWKAAYRAVLEANAGDIQNYWVENAQVALGNIYGYEDPELLYVTAPLEENGYPLYAQLHICTWEDGAVRELLTREIDVYAGGGRRFAVTTRADGGMYLYTWASWLDGAEATDRLEEWRWNFAGFRTLAEALVRTAPDHPDEAVGMAYYVEGQETTEAAFEGAIAAAVKGQEMVMCNRVSFSDAINALAGGRGSVGLSYEQALATLAK